MHFWRFGLKGDICGGRRNRELGHGLGTGLQQSLGVSTAGSDICASMQPALDDNKGIDRYGVVICVRDYRLPLAPAALELPILRLRHL